MTPQKSIQKSFKSSTATQSRRPLGRGWKIYIIVSAGGTISIVTFLILFMLQLMALARSGASGTEIMAITMAPLVLVAFGLAIINAVIYPFLLLRRSMTRKWRAALIILSIPMILFALYSVYDIASTTYRAVEYSKVQEQEMKLQQERDAIREKELIPRAISPEETVRLLQDCKVFGFYYTAQDHDETNAEASSTGILSVNLGDGSYRIHIAERQETTLVPAAQEATAKCDGWPQFWHDNTYYPVSTNKPFPRK